MQQVQPSEVQEATVHHRQSALPAAPKTVVMASIDFLLGRSLDNDLQRTVPPQYIHANVALVALKFQVHRRGPHPKPAQLKSIEEVRQNRMHDPKPALERLRRQSQQRLDQKRHGTGGPGLRVTGNRVIDWNLIFFPAEPAEEFG